MLRSPAELAVNVADKLPQAARRAGIDDWPNNALRHSFASYHLAMHEDAATTAFLMGHRDSNLVYSTYARAVRRSDAVKWWKIMPGNA